MRVPKIEFDEYLLNEIKGICFHLKNINNKTKTSIIKKFHEKCLKLKYHPSCEIFFKDYDYSEYLKRGKYLFNKERGIDTKNINQLLGMIICLAEISKKKKRNEDEEECYNFVFGSLWYLGNLEYYINPMKNISTRLNKENINDVIQEYLGLVNEIEIPTFENTLKLIDFIKRRKTQKGPYPYVSFFESSNRIMTDLVILFGIKMLLNRKIPEIEFEEYNVDFGNNNIQEHDIIVKGKWGTYLVGEAFNVSKSLFKNKKRDSIKKLMKSQLNLVNQLPQSNIKAIIIYNNDADDNDFIYKFDNNIYYLKVDINEYINNNIRRNGI